jgi:hypothetical protein
MARWRQLSLTKAALGYALYVSGGGSYLACDVQQGDKPPPEKAA